LLVLCALPLAAQAGEEVARGRAEIEKLRRLVEAGAVPRAQLEREEARLADAADADLLRATLYGPDLTEDQLEEMTAAAERRWDRRKQELAHARRLVEEGVASQLSIGPYLENLDRARKEYDVAVSRARLVRELTEIARREQELENALERSSADAEALAGRFVGTGLFTAAELRRLEIAFESRFSRALPVSAFGDTAVHRALGFDHRDRVDVAVHPDQAEGVWLRQYLEMNRIPYIAFRNAVRGKSTGAHIHVGPASTRLVRSAVGIAGGS
jgi:hypothetical protein